jgi:hypothetical protein
LERDGFYAHRVEVRLLPSHTQPFRCRVLLR